MDRLVILMIGEGSFTQGFPVTLQIGDELRFRATQVTGKLPPDPELPRLYQQWQAAYRNLGLRLRLSAPEKQVTNVALTQDCQQTARQLRDRLNVWLQSEPFRAIRERWLEKLQPDDTIRVILQTEQYWLQKFPWHLWDLLERYPRAELALSAPIYDPVLPVATPAGNINILAILGNSEGLDTQADRTRLEQLPDVHLRLLVEPNRQEMSDRLWEQPWDILFFAGHSSSHASGNTGCIYINQTDSLNLSELRYALKKSLARGLKLAIFNSCDGLGLARELADLHIPQIIVMREPIPDQVAQAFLQYFLPAYAQGETLYQSVRQARERLQALEHQFPCATWLPVIYQNPAEVPPLWQDLKDSRFDSDGEHRGERDTVPPHPAPSAPPSPPAVLPRLPIWRAIATSLVVTGLLAIVRYLGWLQPLELKAFDQLLRLRPAEWTDSRLLVVTIDEADIQAQKQARGSLADTTLEQLLKQLDRYQPRAIGLDIYRDYGVDAKQPALRQRLQRDGKLLVICKVSDPEHNITGIAPPPEVASDRIGFSDFLADNDGILRRQVLFMDSPANSPCAPPYAFSTQLAFRYLAAEGIQPTFTPTGDLKFGNTVFPKLRSRAGGYQGLHAWGNQILLNYRANPKPVEQVSLRQVLTGQINPAAVQDRIILIGVIAQSLGDYWATPYGDSLTVRQPGVIIQAQMTSQLISAVLDRRPILWVWSPGMELLWLGIWSLAGGVIAWWFTAHRPPRYIALVGVILAVVTATGSLCVICYGILTLGGWVPLVPAVLALLFSTGAVPIYQSLTINQLNH